MKFPEQLVSEGAIAGITLHPMQEYLDLVVATQGRAFWILDDLSALRSWKPEIATAKLHVFAPAPAYRWEGGGFQGQGETPPTAGQNRGQLTAVTGTAG